MVVHLDPGPSRVYDQKRPAGDDPGNRKRQNPGSGVPSPRSKVMSMGYPNILTPLLLSTRVQGLLVFHLRDPLYPDGVAGERGRKPPDIVDTFSMWVRVWVRMCVHALIYK